LNEVPRNKLRGISLLEYQAGTNHKNNFPTFESESCYIYWGRAI